MNLARQHINFAIFCFVMGFIIPAGVVFYHLSGGDPTMSAPEAVYEYARIKGDFTDAQMATISAGVRYAHRWYWGSSGREIFYLIYPASFAALGFIHLRHAFQTRKRKEPDQ